MVEKTKPVEVLLGKKNSGKPKGKDPSFDTIMGCVLPVKDFGGRTTRLLKDYKEGGYSIIYDGKTFQKRVNHPKIGGTLIPATEAEVLQFKADVERAAQTDGDIKIFVNDHPFPKAA